MEKEFFLIIFCQGDGKREKFLKKQKKCGKICKNHKKL
jgi:hypothetical protein